MIDYLKIFILPSGLILCSFVLGCGMLWAKKLRRISMCLLTTSGVLYILFANGPVAFWLLAQLENKHSPLCVTNLHPEIDTIVTLAGYAESAQNRPMTSQFNSATAFRILETVRIAQALPNAKILIVGDGQVPVMMRKMMIDLGLPEFRIMIDKKSTDTYENVIQVSSYCQNKPFVLVTSAGHMPRAMSVFLKAGLEPLPAPTDYHSIENYKFIALFPSPLHLRLSDTAIYEYLGILWYRFRNRV